MPRLIRFMLTNIAIGVLLGWAVGIVLVLSNAQGLGDLVFGSGNPIAAVALLALSFGSTFGLGYFATAVLFLPNDR